MKRTKTVNRAAFRKHWSTRQIASITLVIATAFTLTSCEKSDKNVSLYQKANNCLNETSNVLECTDTYDTALNKPEKSESSVSKYKAQEDCIIAESGENRCQKITTQTGISQANQTQGQQNSNFWMPLITSYMMNRLMNDNMGYQHQSLSNFRHSESSTYTQHADTRNKNPTLNSVQTDRTITTPKIIIPPKSETTTTITRGGFGESLAKHPVAGRGIYRRSMGG